MSCVMPAYIFVVTALPKRSVIWLTAESVLSRSSDSKMPNV